MSDADNTTQTPHFSDYRRAMVDPADGGPKFRQKHFLAIEGMDPIAVQYLLDKADHYADFNRQPLKHSDLGRGLTQINMFFENSTRTLMSFDIAGKRLGLDVSSFSASTSSLKKGETLLDTATTLDAMRPDVVVIRHSESGAVAQLAEHLNCAIINAGDGTHEHPTQALLDALTIRRTRGHIHGLTIAICGDIKHSRVARSNIHLLNAMGAKVRVIGPESLIPDEIERMGVEVFHSMEDGLKGSDIVMMLRIQKERIENINSLSLDTYHQHWGLTPERLKLANEGAHVMHPGPMNRGLEIASMVADDPERSLITLQVEMGVAARMAVIDALTEPTRVLATQSS